MAEGQRFDCARAGALEPLDGGRMRKVYAETLYKADGASLDDLREAVTTLEDADRIARRVFGGAHPNVVDIERELQDARAALQGRA